jgi:hypothetical protein
MAGGTAVAKIKIDADAADVKRVFGDVVRIATSANQDILTSHRKTNAEVTKSLREMQKGYATLANKIKQVMEGTARKQEALERGVSRTVEGESKRRKRATEEEFNERERAAQESLSVHAKVERQKTERTKSEARRRARAEREASGDSSSSVGAPRQRRRRGEELTFSAPQAIRGFANTAHGAIQSERQSRANTERTLDDAFKQAIPSGANRAEIARHRQAVYRFARERGIREEELAPGLLESQSNFAVISNGRTEAERSQRLNGALQAGHLGRLTGNDPSETMRFYSALMSSSMGLNSEQALTLTRRAAAAGFSGSVSLGEASSQALGTMMQHVANARAQNPHADSAQVAQESMMQFFSDLQIQAAVGARAGTSGVRGLNLESRLSSAPMMGQLRERLLEEFHGNAGATQRISNMFNHNAHTGATSLQDTYREDPTSFVTQMFQLYNGDVTRFRNTMGAHNDYSKAAGGHAQIFSSPMLTSMGNMMAVGGDVLEQRNRIMNADITPAQLAEMASVTNSEQDTDLARNQQTQRDALRDNTSAITRLSDRLENFTSRNPILSAALGNTAGAIGGGLLRGAGGVTLARTGAQVAAAAGSGAAGTVAAGAGGTAAAGGAATLGLGGTALVGAAGLVGAVFGDQVINRGLRWASGNPNAEKSDESSASYLFRSRHRGQSAWDELMGVGSYWTGGDTANDTAWTDEQFRNLTERRDRGKGQSWSDLDKMSQTDFNALPEEVRNAISVTNPNNPLVQGGGGGGTPGTTSIDPGSIQQLAQAITERPLIVQIDPHDADHIASNNNTQNHANGGTQ